MPELQQDLMSKAIEVLRGAVTYPNARPYVTLSFDSHDMSAGFIFT
jgi:hypothetical protein